MPSTSELRITIGHLGRTWEFAAFGEHATVLQAYRDWMARTLPPAWEDRPSGDGLAARRVPVAEAPQGDTVPGGGSAQVDDDAPDLDPDPEPSAREDSEDDADAPKRDLRRGPRPWPSEPLELALLRAADATEPVQFGQALINAKRLVTGMDASLERLKKVAGQLVDQGLLMKVGTRRWCTLHTTTGGRARLGLPARSGDRQKSEVRSPKSEVPPAHGGDGGLVQAAILQGFDDVLTDGRRHTWPALLTAVRVYNSAVGLEDIQAVLQRTVTERLVGVSTVGLERRYQKRAPETPLTLS